LDSLPKHQRDRKAIASEVNVINHRSVTYGVPDQRVHLCRSAGDVNQFAMA
jgi:hypothetical protein